MVKDIMALSGLALVAGGCALLSFPAATIAVGAILVAWATIEEFRHDRK